MSIMDQTNELVSLSPGTILQEKEAANSPVPLVNNIENTVANNIHPLLDPENDQLSFFPVKYPEFHEMLRRQRAQFWTVEEVDLSNDYSDFVALKPEEQHFIKYILAFFSQSDGLVNMNLVTNFIDEIQINEIRSLYRYQAMMEDIHNEMYSLMIENIVTDNQEKTKLLDAVVTIPSITKKANWAKKWMDRGHGTFQSRVLAFAIVEGVFFSGAFCSIYWIGEKNKMPGLTLSNEFIARDESMHTETAVMIYNKFPKLPTDYVHGIVREAVAIEEEFICEALPYDLAQMNARLMCQYIEFVADRLLASVGHAPLYNAKNPFPFMNKIGVATKTNFFEKRPTQYQKAKVFNEDANSKFEVDTETTDF